MLTRRDVIIGAGIVGGAALARPFARALAAAPASPRAPQPATPVNFTVPPGACDSHTCVIGDPNAFPPAPSRSYTPEGASIEEMRALHRALHIERVVLVQPSVYGTDNACTLDAVRQFGARARGVVVLADNVSSAGLDDLQRRGACGVTSAAEGGQPEDAAGMRQRFRAAVDRIKGRGWHLEFHGRLADIDAIKADIIASPVPVLLFDHFGGARPALGLGQPGLDTLLGLLRDGKAYVDLSAPERISKQRPDFPDVAPFATAFIAANPRQIVWGTGWPHPERAPGLGPTDIAPLDQVDDGHALNLLGEFATTDEQRRLILSENPARLFGF
jgi:predicted TIM-barrel fold metal-dependent hydrolase